MFLKGQMARKEESKEGARRGNTGKMIKVGKKVG